jgi:hypothetical protein
VDATDVVVYNLNNNSTAAPGPAANTDTLSKTKVGGWTELKNSTVAAYNAWYVDSNNKLKYIVINAAALTTGDKYAIYKESYSDTDKWVVFVGKDPIKRDGTLPAGITKGDVVHYTMSGSDAIIDSRSVPYGTTSDVTVSKVSGATIVLSSGQSYKTDKDTVYYDVKSDTNLLVLDGVAQGDAVRVFADNTGLAQAVVVVKSPTGAGLTKIATAAIAGVTAPAAGATPVATIAATTEYTAAIAWAPADAAFAAGTPYTATITITPKTGYTLTGVAANFFTVAGATATNAANSGVVTAVFPATPAIASVASPTFATTLGDNTVTITLTGGKFKAGAIAAGDFTFVGANAAALAAGTFTRTSDTVVTITGLAGVTTASDNRVLVPAATQAAQAASVSVVSALK